jgi:hypothetical protein
MRDEKFIPTFFVGKSLHPHEEGVKVKSEKLSGRGKDRDHYAADKQAENHRQPCGLQEGR